MPIKDLTNQQFGEITVLELDKELSNLKQRIYWKCRCSCGREKSIRTDGLKKIQTCGECKKDLVGKKFERLTVLKKGKKDSASHQYYICQCDCGNIVEINSDNLRRGLTKSCGCLHKEITSTTHLIDLTGKKFNQLYVIERVNKPGENRVKWKCLCDCGNITEVAANNLINGHTTSCGCNRSKGENLIRKILNNLNIPFKTEYVFKDLLNRRYDFALYDENGIYCLIEYDGVQHYKFVNTWHQTEKEWEESKNRDKEKDDYAKSHNIPLIRIPYYDYNKLNEEYIKEKINERCCCKNL